MLDTDVSKTEELFNRLHLDGSGKLDMEEFTHGCTVQGVATHVDVGCLVHFIKSLTTRTTQEMNAVKEDVHDEIACLDRILDQILSGYVKSMRRVSSIVLDWV